MSNFFPPAKMQGQNLIHRTFIQFKNQQPYHRIGKEEAMCWVWQKYNRFVLANKFPFLSKRPIKCLQGNVHYCVCSVKGAWPCSSPWILSHLELQWEQLVTTLSSLDWRPVSPGRSQPKLCRNACARHALVNGLWSRSQVETDSRGESTIRAGT